MQTLGSQIGNAMEVLWPYANDICANFAMYNATMENSSFVYNVLDSIEHNCLHGPRFEQKLKSEGAFF
jgi:hypothetical protein